MEGENGGALRVFCGGWNLPLYRKVVEELRTLDTTREMLDSDSTTCSSYAFESSARYAQLGDVRRRRVFLFDSLRLCGEDIWTMMVMAQAAKLASAGTIYAVLPFIDLRQDSKERPREAITASLAPHALLMSGVQKFLIFDPHTRQVQGMVQDPMDCLYSPFVFMPVIRTLGLSMESTIVMGPDVGSMKRNGKYAKLLGCQMGCADKRRDDDRAPTVYHVIGDVRGKTVLLCDDIIDTGGTLAGAANAFKDAGAEHIFCFISHGIFSSPAGKASAAELVAKSPIERLYVTDSLQLPSDLPTNVEVVSIADLMARAIFNLYHGLSLSPLILEPGKA